jgi:hypothetical protein
LKFDSVEIQGAMADGGTQARDILAVEWKEFDLDLRADGQIRHGKQAHPDIADVDAECVHGPSAGKYAHRSIEQLALVTSPVWFESTSEKHGKSGQSNVAQADGRTKITKVQGGTGEWKG